MAALDLPCCWLLRLHAPAGSLATFFFERFFARPALQRLHYFIILASRSYEILFRSLFAYVEFLKDVLYCTTYLTIAFPHSLQQTGNLHCTLPLLYPRSKALLTVSPF